MSRVFGLFLFIPIFFLGMCIAFYATFLDYENESLEEFRLRKAVNYAVDAAVEEFLETGDLSMDYANWGEMTLDPSLAAEAFANSFCLNYKLMTNQENRDLVQLAYTRLFTVCVYDGYYVYEACQTGDGGTEFISTPKLPYSYYDNANNAVYALNLGLKDCWRFKTDTNKLSKVDSPISKKEVLREINKRISDDLAYRVDKQYENGWANTLYIPYEMTTVSHTNPVNRPTVLALVDNVDISIAKKLSAFGVGGANVKQARAVAAYIRNGEKYYCYADLLPMDIFTATNPDGTKTFIEQMYMSCKEAAEAGYHHDTLYMN